MNSINDGIKSANKLLIVFKPRQYKQFKKSEFQTDIKMRVKLTQIRWETVYICKYLFYDILIAFFFYAVLERATAYRAILISTMVSFLFFNLTERDVCMILSWISWHLIILTLAFPSLKYKVEKQKFRKKIWWCNKQYDTGLD